MTSDEVKERLEKEPDFVYLPRFEYSLRKLMERYPEGVPDQLIAQALMLTEEEVDDLFRSAVTKLRRNMGVRRGQ